MKWILSLFLLFFIFGCNDEKSDIVFQKPFIDESEVKDIPINKNEENLSIDTNLPPEPVTE